jgi:hypothetical protein
MPAKPASTAGKAPASSTASKAPAKTTSETKAKKATKTSTSADGEAKKKRRKTRKETYSSYIYKGTRISLESAQHVSEIRLSSPQAGPPRYWYFEQGYGHSELVRQRYL